jgi:hypothetical protein
MRHRRIKLVAAVAVISVASVVATTAVAGGGREISEELEGFQEVAAVSTGAEGKFKAKVRGDEVQWELRYEDLEGPVLMAHIHLGQRDVNGGISVWLCETAAAPSPDPETQTCPQSPAKISGTFDEGNVVGPGGQGIEGGEFDELVRAIKAGVTYANVHSERFPNGEIRGQLNDDRDDDD